MRTHQAASSASSAREKWMRPLVVGPSPVMTPSRTMVRARAAVSRQDGSGTPFAAALVLGADIARLLNSFVSRPAFPRGRKRVVNDSKPPDSRFLNGCRFVAFSHQVVRAGRVGGHTRRKRGSGIDRSRLFRRSSEVQKKVLEACADGEGFHLLHEGIHLNPRPALYSAGTEFPCN